MEPESDKGTRRALGQIPTIARYPALLRAPAIIVAETPGRKQTQFHRAVSAIASCARRAGGFMTSTQPEESCCKPRAAVTKSDDHGSNGRAGAACR